MLFLPNFSTTIFKNNIKSENRSGENNFFMFPVPCKKSSHTLFDWFELTGHLYGNPGHVFVQRLCFLACVKFQRIWKKFTKVGALQR